MGADPVGGCSRGATASVAITLRTAKAHRVGNLDQPLPASDNAPNAARLTRGFAGRAAGR